MAAMCFSHPAVISAVRGHAACFTATVATFPCCGLHACTFCYDLLFPCLRLTNYLCVPFSLLTILSYSINSVLHLLLHIPDPLLLHAPTCVPPIAMHLTYCTSHGPPLTPVDLPSSLYFIKRLLSGG